MFFSCHERGIKKIWKKRQLTIIAESFWESLAPNTTYFWRWLFRQCDQTLRGTILKRFRSNIFYVCIGGITTSGRMGWWKSQRPKACGLSTTHSPPPTSPSPSPLHPRQPSYATSVTYHCSWMYKLDLAEILKTTIYMELYPVKMVHDLVILTCINWNEQANKSLRRPKIFHPFGWILVTP